MRILFNATAALRGTSGVVHTVGLLSAMTALNPPHEFVVLTTPEQQFLRDMIGSRVAHHVTTVVGGGGLRRTASLQVALGPIARRLGAGLIYNKGNFHALNAGRQVCFMENTNPFSMLRLGEPAWYRTRNRLLRLMSDWALRYAAAVIFPTEHARRLIAARARISVPAFVVPYGCDTGSTTASTPRSEQPYLLCVSSVLPYKNLSLAIDAFKLLLDQRKFDGKLVIVGVSGVSGAGYYHRLIRRRIDALALSDRIELLAAVDPAPLAALYTSASCLVMPSLEESFGIPIIEAMALGTPVAAARVEGADRDKYFIPFSEICGEAAEYFDPFDAGSCAAAIERTLDPARRAQLIDAGRERASHYSWRAAAEATLKVFDATA